MSQQTHPMTEVVARVSKHVRITFMMHDKFKALEEATPQINSELFKLSEQPHSHFRAAEVAFSRKKR